MRFTWDEKKEESNERKHGVSFSDACLVFSDKFGLNLFDSEHSIEEERWITIGQTINGELLVVVHTFRTMENQEIIRIISARKATREETKQYFKRRL